MIKNNIITKILIIFTLPIIGLIIFYFTNQSNNINPITNQTSISDNYTFEKIIEKESKLAALAVKNYANQDRNESKNQRINRLGLFFTSNSPVYTYENKLLNSKVQKSTAEIISINIQDTEGRDLNLEVEARITLYEKNKTTAYNKKFWVSLIKIFDGSMFPYNIGEL